MMGLLLQINFEIATMGEGTAILLIGFLALLLASSVIFRNPLGAMGTLLCVLIFVLTTTLDVGSELFWMGVVSTVVILIAGIVARVRRL